MFFDTIKDIKKLVTNSTNQYRKEVMGVSGSMKVPYDHLMGRRQKLRQRKAQQKARAR